MYVVKIGNYTDFGQKIAQKAAYFLLNFVIFNYSLFLTNWHSAFGLNIRKRRYCFPVVF